MDTYGAWKTFTVTGKIEDYLNYRQGAENKSGENGHGDRKFESRIEEAGEKDMTWKVPLW